MHAPIPREQITGLVLAGGRGQRMGGVDKGLQLFDGKPLVQHAIERLAPQVGTLLVNANRNLEAYRAFGVPVVADTVPDFAGPLAGWLAGLEQCRTEWLVTVPCDSPRFPLDLVQQLANAVRSSGAELAMAETMEDGKPRTQPVFTILRTSLARSLAAYVRDGGRKIDRWSTMQGCACVRFDDAAAFFNVNTREELKQPQR